ncbi:MAG: hypothetical protein N2V73_00050 [Candidatus Methanospirare jalkutatii]|nr:hypothetical protein [Candidatus Methanospirare jalkutatii]
MEVEIVVVPFLPESESFDTSVLDQVRSRGRIVRIEAEFFTYDGHPYWAA